MTAKLAAKKAETVAPDFISGGLLTPEDVAGIMQVTVNTLQNWRYNGRGPVFSRVGGIIRYTRSDINRFVSDSRQTITGHALALTH